MKLIPDKWNTWHTVASAAGTISIIVTFAWANLAEPRIDKKIDTKLAPFMDQVNKALEYNNCLHMSSMSDEQLKKADELYKQCILAKGMKGRP
jgi:hypothetical protein